jgi:hypothetical protein
LLPKKWKDVVAASWRSFAGLKVRSCRPSSQSRTLRQAPLDMTEWIGVHCIQLSGTRHPCALAPGLACANDTLCTALCWRCSHEFWLGMRWGLLCLSHPRHPPDARQHDVAHSTKDAQATGPGLGAMSCLDKTLVCTTLGVASATFSPSAVACAGARGLQRFHFSVNSTGN